MELKSLYLSFSQHKESIWIMTPLNAGMLYSFIKQHDFKEILDLGTGIGLSAAVIAFAMKDKGIIDYHIDTIEQTEKCYTLAKELIPEELKMNTTFHRVDPVVWSNPDMPYQNFSTFKELPDKEYDFIVVDGPGPYLEGEHLIDLPNGDVMKIMISGKLKAGTFIFFDGRLSSIKSLEKYYSRNFYSMDAINNEYNILERKNGEIIFEDVRKEKMKEMNYFYANNETKT